MSFHLTSILASNIEVIQSKLTSNDLLFSQWPKISIQQPQKPLNRHPAWPIFAKYYKLTVWPPSKRSNDWNWPPMTSNLQNIGMIEISDLKNLWEDTSYDTYLSRFIWPPFWPPIMRLHNQNWPPMTSYFWIDQRFGFIDPKNHRKDTQHDLFVAKMKN